jgi:hypothetical protein
MGVDHKEPKRQLSYLSHSQSHPPRVQNQNQVVISEFYAGDCQVEYLVTYRSYLYTKVWFFHLTRQYHSHQQSDTRYRQYDVPADSLYWRITDYFQV